MFALSLCVIASVACVVAIVILGPSFLWLLIGPVLFLGIPLAYFHSLAESKRLAAFAPTIGLVYAEHAAVDEGMAKLPVLFGFANERRFTHVFSGKASAVPILFYDYGATVNLGTDPKTHAARHENHHFFVFQATYPYRLPHMILTSAKTSPFRTPMYANLGFADSTPVRLEGAFSDKFELSVEKGMETEALEVFTPDIMGELVDKIPDANIEFSGNDLFIYRFGSVDPAKQIAEKRDEYYSLTEKLADHFRETDASVGSAKR